MVPTAAMTTPVLVAVRSGAPQPTPWAGAATVSWAHPAPDWYQNSTSPAALAMVITELVPVCPGTPVQAIFGCWAMATCPTVTWATSCGADHVLCPSACW